MAPSLFGDIYRILRSVITVCGLGVILVKAVIACKYRNLSHGFLFI